jgi:hypothetical protein
MKVLGSPARIRLSALTVTVVGLVTFIGAQASPGRLGIALALISLALFFLEVVFGIADGLNRAPDE